MANNTVSTFPKAVPQGKREPRGAMACIPDPKGSNEVHKQWGAASLIPYMFEGKIPSFLGPFDPNPTQKLLSLFPIQKDKQILAFGDRIRVDYLDNLFKKISL